MVGPVYATPADLAEWLGLDEPSDGAQAALRDASLDVDRLLVGAVYAVDEQGAPTDPHIAEVLKTATLYQAQHGAPELSGRQPLPIGMKTVKIDQISYTAATDPATGRVVVDHYSTRALSLLAVEGLIPNHPMVR